MTLMPQPRTRLVTFFVASVMAVILLATKGEVNTDLSGFMPAAKTLEQRLFAAGISSGPAARWLLLGIEGGDVEARSKLAREIASELRVNKNFTHVNDGINGEINLAALEKLFRYRLLLHPGLENEKFSASSLEHGLQYRVQQVLAGGGELAERLLKEDPLLSTEMILENVSRGGAERTIRNGAWVSSNGEMHLLAVETAAAGSELDVQADNQESIRQLFGNLAPSDNYELLITGSSVFAVMSRDQIKKTVINISVAASVSILLLLLAWFGSPRVLLLAALPLLTGMLAGVTAVVIIFGSIHATSLAFGLTLLGVVVDYPIHYFSHRRLHASAEQALQAIWSPLKIGALTTALAYLVFTTTGFQGLQQLGLLNVIGLLVALFVTRWILPQLSSSVVVSSYVDFFPVPKRYSGKLVYLPYVLIILASMAIWANNGVEWQDDPAALNPSSATQLTTDRKLRQAVAGPDAGRFLVVQGSSAQAVLEQEEFLRSALNRLRSTGAIGGYELAADWLPSIATQRRNQAVLPDTTELAHNLAEAAGKVGVRATRLQDFLLAVKASKTYPPLGIEDISNTPLAARLSTLLIEGDGAVLGIVPFHGAVDPGVVQKALARNFDAVTYVDLRQIAGEVMGDFRNEALYRVGIGGGVIAIALIIFLGSMRRGLVILFPIAATLLSTLAILVILGEALNLFHLLSLLLIVGICMDYGLFFAKSSTDLLSQQRTFWSVSVCALTTTLVFGILALSRIPVLRALGMTTFIGVAIGFLIIFLSVRAESN